MQNQIINIQPHQTICRKCKYFKPDTSWLKMERKLYYGSCMHPVSQKLDIVMRLYESKCGQKGKYYENENNNIKLFFREYYNGWIIWYTICCINLVRILTHT